MDSIPSWLLIFLTLYTPSSGNGFDHFLPPIKDRINAIRKVLIPVSESSFQEALFNIGSYYIPVDGKSALCQNHSNYLLESFLNNDVWALRMIDSSSKLPPGILDGRYIDLGSFDQCLSIVAPGDIFRGQYCIVEIKDLMPDILKNIKREPLMYPMILLNAVFAVCVPSTCSPTDVAAHMDVALQSLNSSALLEDNSCTTAIPEPWSTGEWAAMVVIVLLFTLVFFSTIYDNTHAKDRNKYIIIFSLKNNIPKMLNTETRPESITCLNGLRVLAFLWVILGHRFLLIVAYPSLRLKTIFEQIQSLSWAPLVNMILSVEIFFFLTGFLVTYSIMRFLQHGRQFNLIHFYLLRYLRMTPTLVFVVMVTGTVAIRFSDGPIWKRIFGILWRNCQPGWWYTFLYINNYADSYRLCVPQSWYLAADFQMYAFSPILLIPLFKKPKLGMTLTALSLTLTTAAGLWNAFAQDLRAGGALTLDNRTQKTVIQDYMATHVRSATFIIGIAMGCLVYKVKEGLLVLKLSKVELLAGWLISIFLILSSTLFISHFQQDDYVYNKWLEVVYQVFHRHIFILGISWIVLVCSLGYGGFVNTFLSWKPFIVMARLTYSAFLVHILVQFVFTFNSRTPESFSFISLWHKLFGDITISYLSAMVLYLLVECPCSNIIDLVFQDKKRSEEPPKPVIALNTPTIEMPDFKEHHKG